MKISRGKKKYSVSKVLPVYLKVIWRSPETQSGLTSSLLLIRQTFCKRRCPHVENKQVANDLSGEKDNLESFVFIALQDINQLCIWICNLTSFLLCEYVSCILLESTFVILLFSSAIFINLRYILMIYWHKSMLQKVYFVILHPVRHIF